MTASVMPLREPRQSYREILRRLDSAQKPASRTAPAYSRYVNRRLGRYGAAAARLWGLTPNAVTAVSAGFTLTAIILLAIAPLSHWLGLTVAFCLVVGYALDSADGQLARLTGASSPAGEWLDHVVDATKTAALPIALAVCLYRSQAVDTAWLLVPLLSAVVGSVIFFAMILTEQLRRQNGHAGVNTGGGSLRSRFAGVLMLPMDYGVLCLSFALLAFLPVFLTVYTLILLSSSAFLIVASFKWFREIGNPSAPQANGKHRAIAGGETGG